MYDEGSKVLHIKLTNQFIRKYPELMEESVKDTPISGLKLDSISDDTAELSFPHDLKDSVMISPEIGLAKLNKSTADKLNGLVNRFLGKAFSSEMKQLEIIPLSGYDLTSLKSDIDSAIKAKRGFCLVDTFSNYKKFAKQKTSEMNQAKFEFLSNEYCDLVIDIYRAKSTTELKKKYSSCLSNVNWLD